METVLHSLFTVHKHFDSNFSRFPILFSPDVHFWCFWCDQSFHVYSISRFTQSNDLYAVYHTELIIDNDKHLLANIVNNDDCIDGLPKSSRHVAT